MATGRDVTAPPQALPYAFTVDGWTYRVRARTTTWWVRIMAARSPGFWMHGVLFNLDVQEGAPSLVHRLMDNSDPFDLDDAERLCEEVLSKVMGMEPYSAHRLLGTAFGNWMAFDGWALTKGFEPTLATPGRVATAVYAWRLGHCQEKKDVNKLHGEIFGPPPAKLASGRFRDAAPRTWNERAEAAAFDQALVDMGKG